MSYKFATASDFLSSATVSINATPFTIALWYKNLALGVAQTLFSLGLSGASNQRYSLAMLANNTCQVNTRVAAGNANATIATIADNAWHLLVGTFAADNTNRYPFIDGANKPAANPLSATPTAPTYMRVSGDPAGVTPGNGAIAHIAAWNIEMADVDVLSLYTKLPNLVQSGNLVHYWTCRESGVSTLTDLGSGNKPLTINGGAIFDADDPFTSGGGTMLTRRLGRR